MGPPPKSVKGLRVNVAPRLPPLERLHVRKPNVKEVNPCQGILSSMLGCWASSGQEAAQCIQLEQSLKACVDQRKNKQTKKNNINYHLGRMYPSFIGPHKRK